MKPMPAKRLSDEGLEQLDGDARVVAAIQEGLADVEAGRFIDDVDLDDVLRARLGDLID
jgi:predicted transcriptional regulator